MNTKIILAILLSSAMVVGSSMSLHASFLFYDNFQTLNNKHWLSSVVDQDKISLSNFQANTTLKLQASSSIVADISTLGFRNVRFTASLYGRSLENDEYCLAEISIDQGRSWQNLASLGEEKDDGFTASHGQIYPADADNQPQVLLRLSSHGNQINDECYFDEIKVLGEKIYRLNSNDYGNNSFSYDFFSSEQVFTTPVNNQFFYPASTAKPASNTFQGSLNYSANKQQSIQVIEDVFSYRADLSSMNYDQMPAFNIELVQSADSIIPVQRGPQASNHPHWEIMLEPGKVWDQVGDQGYSRAALPFALQQKGANCVHNGLMSFLYKSSGEISRILFQMGSETCSYFKFDLWGSFSGQYQPKKIANKQDVIAAYQQEITSRLPTRSISEIGQDFPQVDASGFGSVNEIHPANMTTYGVVIDGINYASDCPTRFGPYPFCDVFDLPSYSTAKTVTGLAYTRIVKLHPEITGMSIAELVPACKAENGWDKVTIEDALNMTTGHYISDGYEVDEYVAMVPFFETNTHAGKIAEACHYPAKVKPGTKWVYHTSDTYLFATAINNFWMNKYGPDSDYFRDTMWPVLDSIGLSPMMKLSRRTYDQRQQVYAGYGLTYHRGDIAKLAATILPLDTHIANLSSSLDEKELRASLQMDADDRGVYVADDTRYKNAFWAWNAQKALNCPHAVWIPFMSGFGGNTVAMMPNGIAYYVFSDNHNYVWAEAVRQADKIKPLCTNEG